MQGDKDALRKWDVEHYADSFEVPATLIGWRAWEVDKSGMLTSFAYSHENPDGFGRGWEPGINRAACYHEPPCDEPPGESCNCGFSVVQTREALVGYMRSVHGVPPPVIGCVEASGRILPDDSPIFKPGRGKYLVPMTELRGRVWRAEKAEILKLFVTDQTAVLLLDRLRRRYGVPVQMARRGQAQPRKVRFARPR